MGIESPPYSGYLLRTEQGYKIKEDAPKEAKKSLQRWIKAFKRGDNISTIKRR